jgi:hypothetical protein
MFGISIAPAFSGQKSMERQFTEFYFLNDGTINLMRRVLRGLDRGVLGALGYAKVTAWPGTR